MKTAKWILAKSGGLKALRDQGTIDIDLECLPRLRFQMDSEGPTGREAISVSHPAKIYGEWRNEQEMRFELVQTKGAIEWVPFMYVEERDDHFLEHHSVENGSPEKDREACAALQASLEAWEEQLETIGYESVLREALQLPLDV